MEPSAKTIPTTALQAGLLSFGSILVAEMGDKTQLATMLLSARSANPFLTFVAAALALVATSLIGVWAGMWVAKVLPPRIIKLTAGIGFVGIGAVILWRSWTGI